MSTEPTAPASAAPAPAPAPAAVAPAAPAAAAPEPSSAAPALRDGALPTDLIEARLLAELPGWYLEGGWIRRKIKTSGWKATLMVVNTVGHLAEAAWHHPDLTVSYAFVIIKLQSHDAKGITEKDFALAAKIESVLMWQPGREPGAALEGTPDDPRFKYIKYG